MDPDGPARNPDQPPPPAQAADAGPLDRQPPPPVESAHEPPRNRLSTPHFGYAILWTILVIAVQFVVGIGVLVVLAIGAMVVGAASPRGPEQIEELLQQLTLVMIPVATLVMLITALAVVFLLFGRQAPRNLGWRGLSPMQLVLVMLALLPMTLLASEVTNWAARVMPPFELEQFQAFAQLPWIVVLLFGCLLPGVSEEIYFRGFLGRGLVAWHGVLLGGLLTSLLFGLVHLAPVQATGAFVLGMGLHYVFLTTRSLLAPILLHAFNNTLSFAAYRYGDLIAIPGYTTLPDDGVAHTPLPLLLAAVVALLPLLALLYQTRTRWQLADGSEWSPGYCSAERPPDSLAARPLTGSPAPSLLLLGFLTYAALLAAVVWSCRLGGW